MKRNDSEKIRFENRSLSDLTGSAFAQRRRSSVGTRRLRGGTVAEQAAQGQKEKERELGRMV
jgi:hypothetical protein